MDKIEKLTKELEDLKVENTYLRKKLSQKEEAVQDLLNKVNEYLDNIKTSTGLEEKPKAHITTYRNMNYKNYPIQEVKVRRFEVPRFVVAWIE